MALTVFSLGAPIGAWLAVQYAGDVADGHGVGRTWQPVLPARMAGDQYLSCWALLASSSAC